MSSTIPETKKKILAAALKLLKAEGGKGVRMSDIAKEAGVSRQAVYLNFESRLNLMVATVQYADDLNDAERQVSRWRDSSGIEKLDLWIEFWGGYIPQIYGVAKALMVAKEADEAAAAAWDDRMSGVRQCCKVTIESLVEHGQLSDRWNSKTATELLWTMLSVPSWEQYSKDCGWSTKRYVKTMKEVAHSCLVKS